MRVSRPNDPAAQRGRPPSRSIARPASRRTAAPGACSAPRSPLSDGRLRGAIAVGPALRVSAGAASGLPLTCGQRRSGERGAGSGWPGGVCLARADKDAAAMRPGGVWVGLARGIGPRAEPTGDGHEVLATAPLMEACPACIVGHAGALQSCMHSGLHAAVSYRVSTVPRHNLPRCRLSRPHRHFQGPAQPTAPNRKLRPSAWLPRARPRGVAHGRTRDVQCDAEALSDALLRAPQTQE